MSTEIDNSIERAKKLNELIEKELSREDRDGSKLKKLYLAAITLLNSYYSSIIYSEFNRTVCEIFHLPLDNSEFINATSMEYNKLSANVIKIETIRYSNINDILDSYVNQDLDEKGTKIKR